MKTIKSLLYYYLSFIIPFKDTIRLNKRLWDMENFATEMTFDDAKLVAAQIGKRLPTQIEFKALLALPNEWDDTLKGRWFAATAADLATKDKTKCLFFSMLSDCYYWSSTEYSSSSAYDVDFGVGGVGNGFSGKHFSGYVRCVR